MDHTTSKLAKAWKRLTDLGFVCSTLHPTGPQIMQVYRADHWQTAKTPDALVAIGDNGQFGVLAPGPLQVELLDILKRL